MSASSPSLQSAQLSPPLPSRVDLLSTDTKSSELLSKIITEYSPKSWYYFLEHILHIKKGDLNPHTINTNEYCYKFSTFNKFFEIFKSGFQNHEQLFQNIFYGRIWILHANSHLIDYKTNPIYTKSPYKKKNKFQCISTIYKKLYNIGIGTNNGEFYIEWAKYYILRKKYNKAKQRLRIGKKKSLSIANFIGKNELDIFYCELNGNNSDDNNRYDSYSDLSSSSDSSIEESIDSENENENNNNKNMEIDNGKIRKTSFIFKPPQRVINDENDQETDSDYFDDEEESEQNNTIEENEQKLNVNYNINGVGQLHSITENRILSPHKNVRTPFAVIKRNNNNTLYNIDKLIPYTPNTLIKNLPHFKSNGKFINRSNNKNNISHKSQSSQIKLVNTNKKRRSTPHPYKRTKSHSVTSNINTIKYNNKTVSPYTDKKSESRSKSQSKSPSLPSLPPEPSHWHGSSNKNGNKRRQYTAHSHSNSSPLQQIQPQPMHNKRHNKQHNTRDRHRNDRNNNNNNNNNRDRNRDRNRNRNRDRICNNNKNKMSVITMKGRKIMQLKRIGKGGSGEVYQIITQDTLEILALKKIWVPNSLEPSQSRDPMENFLNEIELLKSLRNEPYCIQMIDYEIIDDKNYNRKEIRMLFECGEIDLSHLLKSQPNGYFIHIDPVRHYWRQILSAVNTVHKLKIVHGDLKPANFLLVKGELKLIDFGIAKQIVSNETTRIARDSQIGTLNYICPEALISTNNEPNGMNQYKLGKSADVWSLGCILHQMVFGYTPFTHLKFALKLQAIVSESCHALIKKHESGNVNHIIKNCLIRQPKKRITINGLINHHFLDSVRIGNFHLNHTNNMNSLNTNSF